MKAEYIDTQIHAPSKDDDETLIWATVVYKDELENGCVQSVKVEVLIEDPNIAVNQIGEAAIKKANELLKKAISENQ